MSSVKKNAYDGIRHLIISGEFVAGDPMPEEMLAEQLKISRTPVRDALHQLEAEGVVERRENRRAYLAAVNPMSVVDIFSVRARLEPLAARLAAANVDDAFLTDLRELVDEMDRTTQQIEPDRRLYREQNEHFHWRILKQSDSSAVATAVRGVARHRITSPTFDGWSRSELERSQNHHVEIIDAFLARDPNWADAIMTAHLYAARSIYERAAFGHCGSESQ